jgi:hypothetical protein
MKNLGYLGVLLQFVRSSQMLLKSDKNNRHLLERLYEFPRESEVQLPGYLSER